MTSPIFSHSFPRSTLAVATPTEAAGAQSVAAAAPRRAVLLNMTSAVDERNPCESPSQFGHAVWKLDSTLLVKERDHGA